MSYHIWYSEKGTARCVHPPRLYQTQSQSPIYQNEEEEEEEEEIAGGIRV